MRRTRRYRAAWLLLLLAGCAKYRPKPLDAERTWRQLESVRLEDLAAKPAEKTDAKSAGKPGSEAAARPKFDYSDGLSAEEAAGLALVLNPELRAFRMEEGIARGQWVGAGLLPNPEISDSKFITPLNAPAAWSAEINTLFDFTEALIRRGPRKKRARIQMEAVRLEVADREWRLAAQVKLAFMERLYWDEVLALNRQQQRVASDTLSRIRARQARGAATELDVLLAGAEEAGFELQEKTIQGERRQARQRLNRLLGLPPDHETRLQTAGKPFAYAPFAEKSGPLRERIRKRRPDILAAEKEYQAAEQALRLAFRKRFPRLQLGPSYDGGTGQRNGALGFQLALELPIFNRNQGEIAVREAEREQKRLAFRAKLHAARAEFQAAWTNMETAQTGLQFYFSHIAPKLDRSLKLTVQAFRDGELDLFKVLVLQGRMLQSKREVLRRLRDFHRAKIEVQKAAGPKGLAPEK